MKTITIVAPIYNEEKTLALFTKRLLDIASTLKNKYLFEYLFVDDGSTDNSLKTATTLAEKHPELKIVELRNNFGQTAALQAGLDLANGDIIITMDSDLQHFPENIPAFLEQIEAGYDVVCGWRHNRQEGKIRRWPSRVANYFLRKITRLKIHDIGTTFRAYQKDIIKDIKLFGENHRFIPVFAKHVGAKITEVTIDNIERPEGNSNYGISRTFGVFADLFFIYFFANYLDKPIRIFGKIALSLFSIGFLIALYIIFYSYITGYSIVHNRIGWVFLSVLLIITSVQILLTGLISEILVRIYYSSSHQNCSYKIRRIWQQVDKNK